MTTIITTSGRPDEAANRLAAEASRVLTYKVVERKKRSIRKLQNEYEANVLVASSSRYELYYEGMEKPFFFHPNSAAFRVKRLMNGEKDPLIVATRLKTGESFLDCTLGLASDSIVASFVTGEEGAILGLEANPDIAFVTDCGLRSFPSESKELTEAMKRIQVRQGEAISLLKELPDSSWDVVYLDPMFSAPINESSNFTPLRQVGYSHSLSKEWIKQAVRVSKKCVVVKDRFDSPIFEQFQLTRKIRPNTKFHFGVLDK